MEPIPQLAKPVGEAESMRGRKNIYVCDKCFGHVVTVDVDDGTTPFGMNCRATFACTGAMRSSMYRVFDQTMAAAFEWYRPTALQRLSPGEAEHVARGGLLIRPVTIRSAMVAETT